MINTFMEKSNDFTALIQSEGLKANERIIKIVESLLRKAVTEHVSDIHIEPNAQRARVRFRRDGLLYQVATLSCSVAMQINARLKVLGNMNIAEKRLAQDGRITLKEPVKIDIRISTCPTLYGEKIVLRILNSIQHLDIEQLGMTSIQKEIFLKKINQPQGLILVTGPTGSGKTTTLYSALNYLNTISRNIITIEDPVEIELNGINQINTHHQIGINFTNILRALLRQDPDIMMIGEIRDKETAEIAVQAAETGHLVFSTLHTNSAIESLFRLQNLIGNTDFIYDTSLIIAQRLLRKLCLYCRLPSEMQDKTALEHTKDDTSTTFKSNPNGCQHCRHGYQGRIAVYECLNIDTEIINMLREQAPPSAFYSYAATKNFTSLWTESHRYHHAGLTSMAEIQRVISQASY